MEKKQIIFTIIKITDWLNNIIFKHDKIKKYFNNPDNFNIKNKVKYVNMNNLDGINIEDENGNGKNKK